MTTNEATARADSHHTHPHPPKAAAPDIANAKGSQALFLAWIMAVMTTPIKLRGEAENLLAHIFGKTNKAVPANLAVWWGFPSTRALNPQAKMLPVEVWYPSTTHKRGRLTDPSISLADQKKMDPTKVPGPTTSNGDTIVFLNPRLGAGMKSHDAALDVVVALLHGLLLAARGEPEADKSGRIRPYGGDYWTDAVAVGFDKTDARQKFIPTVALRHILDDIVSQVGDLPQGIIAAEPGYTPAGTPGYKVVCPYDLTPDRKEKSSAALRGGGDKIIAAIASGVVHTVFRASGAYNTANALPWCHREHITRDEHGKHPKDAGPQQCVMLTTLGTPIPIGKDPREFLAETKEAAIGAPRDAPEVLAATGTDGPIREGVVPPVAPAPAPSKGGGRTSRKK